VDELQFEEVSEPWLEPGFGLDPYVLPQFDLLVADGKITREFADQVIAERRAAGYAMTPAELQPRPVPVDPKFEWLSRAGGPTIRESDEHVTLGDRVWRLDRYTSSNDGRLNVHVRNAPRHCWYTLEKSSYPAGSAEVRWKVTQIIWSDPVAEESGTKVFVDASSTAKSVDDAIKDAFAFPLEPEMRNGMEWYDGGKGEFVAAVDGDKVTIQDMRKPEHMLSEDHQWLWKRRAESIQELTDCLGIYEVSGWAATREKAESDAVQVIDKVKAVAARLVGDVDSFEAGRLAGRAELKAEIAGLK